MKKFLGGVKKNIFYISLITGMAVLVTVLGLYNAKTNSKDKNIMVSQNTPNENTSEPGVQTKENSAKENLASTNGSETKETLSGKDASDTADNSTEDGAVSAGQDGTDGDAAKEDGSDVEAETTETSAGLTDAADELNYDPAESISWPVVGNVIIPYSMDTTVYFESLNEYKCSPAMVIEAQAGEEVKAVYECKVSEVSGNSEIGNYVKLDLGNGYIVTLGQLQDVKVALGDHLTAGQVVGTVGEPSRFYSKEGTNLYFAIEKDGAPVDPMLLIQ